MDTPSLATAFRPARALAPVLALFLLAACAPLDPPAATAPATETLGHVVASARGRVDVEGGVVQLAARRDGVIDRVLVEEGDRVAAGQLLATLDDDLARRSLLLAEGEMQLAEQELHRARLTLGSARREVERYESMGSQGAVARQELDRARDAQQLAEVALRAAEVSAQIARSRRAVAEREVEERRVVAPTDGRILRRQARPGNGVSTLNVTPLFLFAAQAPYVVRAELEEQFIEAVRLEQPVEVILEAEPDRRLVGRVQRIGRMVGARTPGDDPGERQDNRVVDLLIALPSAEDLLIGQRVIVRLLRNDGGANG